MEHVGNWIYSNTDKIGKGTCSEVFKGYNKDSKIVAAIKIIDKDKLYQRNYQYIKHLKLEIKILTNLNHENIVKLYEAIHNEKKIYLIFEYCGGGDLSIVIKKYKKISEQQIKNWISQLASGLKFLRSKNLVHRDLKPQNLLLSTDDPLTAIIKIADFGMTINENKMNKELLCGTPLYLAPEILNENKYDIKSDLWSVGCILYELLTGRSIVKVSDYQQLLTQINQPIIMPTTTTKESLNLLQRLLEPNIKRRITWEEFFSHPFVACDLYEFEKDCIFIDVYEDQFKKICLIIKIADCYYQLGQINESFALYLSAFKLIHNLILDIIYNYSLANNSIKNIYNKLCHYVKSYGQYLSHLTEEIKLAEVINIPEKLIYDYLCVNIRLSELTNNPYIRKWYSTNTIILIQLIADKLSTKNQTQLQVIIEKINNHYCDFKIH